MRVRGTETEASRRAKEERTLCAKRMIRMLDHTADIGFEIGASTLDDLFDQARRALLLTMFERPPGQGKEEYQVRLEAPDRETLLVRWINELVFFVQEARFVPVRAEIRVQGADEEGFFLEARLAGAPLDFEGYGWRGEIKSATFHGLDVTHDSKGWRAQVILDV